jgi:WD40 repeat protein
MAPEQASGREPITAAADIYGIGAILYQLITGHPPFKAPSSVETLRWVVEEEPRRPRDLNGLVPLDLESVCLKCLEKEPRRRYASAEALAEDLRRFLAREPVAARPVGRIERSWRWCRRHPAPAAIGLLLGVLAIGASLSAWGLSRARDHAFQSLRAARLAEAKALALSGKPGQRRGALAAVREAARHGRDLELRNAAVAALASTDLEVAREWQGCPPGTESVAFDGDLRRYARGDRTGGISVRDVDGDRELVRLEGPAKKALVIGFGPDDRLLAARYGDSQGANDLWVWDWAAGKRLFAPSPGAFQFAADLRASPPAVAAADPGGVLRVFALPSGELVSELSLGGMSHLVRFNPRGSQLAASTGRSLLVYDAESGRSEANLAHHDQVSSITWHPDGEQLASAAGNAVYLWKWRAPREPLRTFRAAESAGLNVTFSHAGDLLASSSFDGGLKLIGAGGSRLLSDESARSWPQWSRDDRLLGYFRNEGQLGFWQVTRNEVCRTLPVPGRYLGAPAFAGGLLWCPSRAGVHCWDLERGRELALLPLTGVGDVVRAGEDAILTASSQGLLSWPLAPGVEAERRLLRIGPPRRLALAPGDRLQDADLSSDGRYLGLVHEEPANHVLLLDLARDGAVIRTLEHYNVVWIAVARDAAWVAGGALYGHDFKVWRGQTGEEAWRFPAPVDNLTARPAFTPDGRKLLLSTDSGFSLYETGSWRLLHTFARKEFTEHPGAPAIAPDGRTAALAMGRLIAIADLESGAELATLASPEPSLISNLGFSPGGGWLVAATRQDSVHVWRLAALRRGLADLGLDWDLPAAAAEGGAAALPVVVEVDSGAPTGER